MVGRRLRIVAALVVLALIVFGLFLSPAAWAAELERPLPQAGVNLLTNPGFEGIGKSDDNMAPNSGNWTRDTYTGAQYGEIFTPEGWVTWWSEADDFKRPECKVIPREHPFTADPIRIHKGYYSGMCFAFWGKQNAGYFQVVRNITPGSVVEGSFYAHAWSCGDDNPPTSCGDPYSFYFRVGIDPNGGTDPFSSNITWSPPYYNYDTYGVVGPVQATVGASGAATLFLQSYGKWPIKHNDAYMDSAALTMVAQAETPTPTNEPPPPTSETPPTAVPPQYTPTPLPDGTIVHRVVEGDTIFGIALAYGIDPDQIYELNPGLDPAFLQIGQDVVISGPGGGVAAPTATLAPTEEAPEVATPAPTSASSGGGIGPAAPAPGKASVCVVAFYDANEDMFRQPQANEMLLPDAQLNLLAQSGPVDEYVTDGISEPWCFRDLDPGTYILRHTAPTGYVQSNGAQWTLNLDAGEVETVELAYKRDGAVSEQPETSGTPAESAEQEEGEEEGGSRVTSVLNVVLRVSGFIVLALAIAVLVLFVLSRRTA